MIGLLLRLYPARWRARYGDEFAAVLESRQLGPFDVADVVLAAIDAHLHLRGRAPSPNQKRGISMSNRIGGGAAILGGTLMFTGLAWSVWDPADSDPGIVVVFFSLIALLVGLIGVSAFQARQHGRLIWAAVSVPAIGTILEIVGMVGLSVFEDREIVGGLHAWEMFMIGLVATFVGSVLFALATYRTRAMPRAIAVVLGGASIVAVVAVLGGIVGGGPFDVLLYVAIAGFCLGWVGIGWSAIRSGRPASAMAA
jgi:drug/metabolite transporter (DMT)-like permease